MELRASSIASLPPSKRQAFLDSLDADELAHLEHDWRFWARDDQLAPPGAWRIWLLLAGRGFGKTRVGAEWCHERAAASVCRLAIVGATKEDAEKICVTGESGVMATAKPWFLPTFKPSKNGGTVTWPNGSIAELYSGDKPDGLRGPQFHGAWLDELLKWRRGQATWDMLSFGLRLGQNPQRVITTTPTPAKLLKMLMADKRVGPDGLPLVRITRGATYANAPNLAEEFLDELRTKYEGTRLGRQELYGEILDDKPGALWTYRNLDEHRINDPDKVPKLDRVVVAIDPPVTSGEDADECGIIAAGRGPHSHAYVLQDASERGLSPHQWAEKALRLYHDHGAGLIVAEANNGGEMIRDVIKTQAPDVFVKLVWATSGKGKVARAEPVSNLYEQGRVHHVGTFKALEDQMCFPAGTLVETARGQVPIERVVAGDLVMTRAGYRPVEIACETGWSSEFVVIETTDGRVIRCTPTHPIFDAASGQFVPAKSVAPGMLLDARPNPASMGRPSLGVASGGIACPMATIGTPRGRFSIARFGKRIAAQSLKAVTSIIATAIRATMRWTISLSSLPLSTPLSMSPAAFSLSGLSGAVSAQSEIGSAASGTTSRARTVESQGARHTSASASSAITGASDATRQRSGSRPSSASDAARASDPSAKARSIAVRRVTTLRTTTAERVFNLKVDGLPEFYANGILTHNCDFTTDFDPKKAGYSPDRVDALVWAITELMLTAAGRSRGGLVGTF